VNPFPSAPTPATAIWRAARSAAVGVQAKAFALMILEVETSQSTLNDPDAAEPEGRMASAFSFPDKLRTRMINVFGGKPRINSTATMGP